ncbi:MAG: DUF3592 domain-containing protein [Runella sp.]
MFHFIFILLGLIFLVIAWFIYQNQREFLTTAKTAEGVVKQLMFSSSRKSRGTYHPLVEFQTPDGQIHSFRSETGSNPAAYEVGERVEVKYDPRNPSQAKLNSFWDLWGLLAVLAGFGMIFFMVGVGSALGNLQEKKRIDKLKNSRNFIYLPARVEYSDIKGSKGFYLVCDYLHPADEKIYLIKSDLFYFDPTPYLKERVMVWIDPENPKNHYVDTSFMPSLAK